ncbi:MAG: hypothetical protein VKJ24_14460 [Synechococcales bacterium]|nr:hypothetical protein [Synechococcales bacterium]
MNAAQLSPSPLSSLSFSMWQWLNWQRLKNWWQDLHAYQDMSPDLKTRRQIQLMLQGRDAYGLQDWYHKFWEPLEVDLAVVTFVYQQLAQLSGLDMSRSLPDDRLIEDLQFPLICWFDWESQLSDAWNHQFPQNAKDPYLCYLDSGEWFTLKDLMLTLQQEFLHLKKY